MYATGNGEVAKNARLTYFSFNAHIGAGMVGCETPEAASLLTEIVKCHAEDVMPERDVRVWRDDEKPEMTTFAASLDEDLMAVYDIPTLIKILRACNGFEGIFKVGSSYQLDNGSTWCYFVAGKQATERILQQNNTLQFPGIRIPLLTKRKRPVNQASGKSDARGSTAVSDGDNGSANAASGAGSSNA